MKQPRSDAPQRKPRRRWRWHIPPAILHGPETLEGTLVLEEVESEKGLLLWQAARDVTLWSSVEPVEKREGLFAAEAGERRREVLGRVDVGELKEAMETLARMLESPAQADSEEVRSACEEVSRWAEENGLAATALAFAQAGALAAPRHAAAGLRVGVLARDRGEDARAETWFRRTIGLARQSKDWESYSRAFISLGNLYVRRGNLPVARHLHIRALRAARRHSFREIQGKALHNLFGIALEMGRPKEAESYARAALEAYGPEHPGVPLLAHDVAYFWTTLGHFSPALSVFQALLPVIRKPKHRVAVLGNLARAAGGTGDRETYEEAKARVWEMTDDAEAREYAARALLGVAHGASSVGEWSEAERAARAAQEIAEERQEARVQHQTEVVLEAVRSERSAEAAAAGGVDAEDVDALAADFVRSLREHSAAG